MRFHTRHIPRRHLDMDTPMARAVVANGLCDTLQPDILARLVDIGVDTVETRVVWWEVEPQPGQWDFSDVETDLRRIRGAGLRAGVFIWPQHPPEWFRNRSVRLKCLEHGLDSSILSIWDTATGELYERLFGQVHRQLAGAIDWVTLGISGDFGEYAFPAGVKHYRFSSPHGHGGLWCGDCHARRSFREYVSRRYETMAALNNAWDTSLAGLDGDIMPADLLAGGVTAIRNDDAARGGVPSQSGAHSDEGFSRRWHPGSGSAGPSGSSVRLSDFATWYTDSLDDFADQTCRSFRRLFPDVPGAIPVGFPYESLSIGQVKSRPARLAARYNLYCRWTGIGYSSKHPQANVLTRRLSSCSRFYHAHLATEAALVVDEERAVACLYEAFSNGTELIHDDPRNIFAAEKCYRTYFGSLPSISPRCHMVGLYPTEAELAGRVGLPSESELIDWYARLLSVMDVDLFDMTMYQEGIADRYTDLLVPPSTILPAHWLQDILSRSDHQRIWLPRSMAGVEDRPQMPLGQWAALEPGIYRYHEDIPQTQDRYITKADSGHLILNTNPWQIQFHPEEDRP